MELAFSISLKTNIGDCMAIFCFLKREISLILQNNTKEPARRNTTSLKPSHGKPHWKLSGKKKSVTHVLDYKRNKYPTK